MKNISTPGSTPNSGYQVLVDRQLQNRFQRKPNELRRGWTRTLHFWTETTLRGWFHYHFCDFSPIKPGHHSTRSCHSTHVSHSTCDAFCWRNNFSGTIRWLTTLTPKKGKAHIDCRNCKKNKFYLDWTQRRIQRITKSEFSNINHLDSVIHPIRFLGST